MMQVVIDFRLTDAVSEAMGDYFETLMLELAADRPDARFVFLCYEPPAKGDLAPNIVPRVLKSSSFKWLDQKKLLNLLNETRAAVYIRFLPGGFLVCTPAGTVFSGKNLQQPAKAACFSGVGDCYQPKGTNENVPLYPLRPVLPEHSFPNGWTETENIRIQYTGGKSFFLFTGDITAESRLIELLKAFSVFKKWQQSNMQLIIAGYNSAWAEETFRAKLATYKYRDDVALLTGLADAEIARLAAACYAMVYPCSGNQAPVPLLYAVDAGAALIAANVPANRAITQSARWVNTENLVEDLSSAMIVFYRDENERDQYAQQIKAEQVPGGRKMMLERIWEIIKQ